MEKNTTAKRSFLRYLRENNLFHSYLFGSVHYQSAIVNFVDNRAVVVFPTLKTNMIYFLFYDSPFDLIRKIDRIVNEQNRIVLNNRNALLKRLKIN